MTEDRHPPLDDRELALLCRLAIQVIAAQTDGDLDATVKVLDELAAQGRVDIWRNHQHAVLTVRDDAGQDRVLVDAQRDWLHDAAHRADPAMN